MLTVVIAKRNIRQYMPDVSGEVDPDAHFPRTATLLTTNVYPLKISCLPGLQDIENRIGDVSGFRSRETTGHSTLAVYYEIDHVWRHR